MRSPIRIRILACLTVAALRLPAQQILDNQSRLIPVTVTDRLSRFVHGLDQDSFEILESGVSRPITDFSASSPMSLAVVSDAPIPALTELMGSGDELIETSSMSNALRQLAASKNLRKTLVVVSVTDIQSIPPGVQLFLANSASLTKIVIELRNQYLLRFQPSTPSARVEVNLKQRPALPAFRIHSRPPF